MMESLEQRIAIKRQELAELEQEATANHSRGSKEAIQAIISATKNLEYISACRDPRWSEGLKHWFVWTEQAFEDSRAAMISATLANSLSFSVDMLTLDETLKLLNCLNEIYQSRDEAS